MKKTMIVLIIFVLILVLGAGIFFLFLGREKEEELTSLPTPEVFLETTLEERPFISLTPSSDGHWLILRVDRIQAADSLEYELIYKTEDGINQGSLGTAQVAGSSYEKEILLGTESSGHYRYHEGVKEGSLEVRLAGGKGPRKFTTDFYLAATGLIKEPIELVSADGKFSFQADLATNQFYLVIPTIGLPGKIEKEVVVGPYGVFTSGLKSVKNGQVEIDGRAEIAFWDGEDWQELEKGIVSAIGVFAGLKTE
jgi:hypothetical protein